MSVNSVLRVGLGALLVLCACVGPVAAQPAATPDIWGDFPVLSFDDLTKVDGLPHDTISALAQDSEGLIWIGTLSGLARFDGYRLRVWEGDPDAAGALPDAYIRALLPLASGAMLVGTGTGGLVRYDPVADRFNRVTSPDEFGTRVYALAASHDNRGDAAWVATEDGLARFTAADGDLRTVPLLLADGRSIDGPLFAVFEDVGGDLWIGGAAGLLVRRIGDKHFTRITFTGPAAAVFNSPIWAIHRDSAGRLWVGSQDSGIAYIASQDGQAYAVPGLTGPEGAAGRRTIRDVAEVPGRGIWFGTDGAGLVTVDPANFRIRTIRHDPVLPGSLNGDRLRSILTDKTGNVWLGTHHGLERFDPYADRIRTVPATPLSPLALSNPEIFSTLVDGQGRVWVGLANGDIDVLDLSGQWVQRLRLPPPHNGRDINAMLRLPDGSILIGGRGVAAVGAVGLNITASAVPCVDGQIIMSLALDGEDVMIGSYSGLTRYRPATGACTHYLHDAANPKSLANNYVRAVLRLPGGGIAVATGDGVSISDDQGGFHNHRPDPTDPDSLSHGDVFGMALDGHGRLWLATTGGGLVVTDVEDLRGKPRFRAIRRRNGLPHDYIGGVGVDPKGRIWFTTPTRVGMLDPESSRFTVLSDRDGVGLKSYVLRTMAWGPDGRLLLGGQGGLALLDTVGSGQAAPRADLRVTGLSINHQPRPPADLPAPDGALRLDADQRTLGLDFALLDYRSGTDLRYRHRLDGFDNDWLDSPARMPGASYTNLPAGKYILQIEALLYGAAEPVARLTLPVHVAPYWYETVLARVAAAFLALVAVLGIVQARTAALRRQRRHLETVVAERTRDLVAANSRLDILAGTDPLTGLLNRRRFLELAELEQQRATRHRRPLSLLLLDLDHFKKVNDTHGHRMGDAVLRTAAGLIHNCRRVTDLAARFGGEEMVLLLPETDAAGAMEVAERLRRSLASTATNLDGVDLRVTASIGVAGWQGPGESLDMLLHRADTALYAAKAAGRDRVVPAAT